MFKMTFEDLLKADENKEPIFCSSESVIWHRGLDFSPGVKSFVLIRALARQQGTLTLASFRGFENFYSYRRCSFIPLSYDDFLDFVRYKRVKAGRKRAPRYTFFTIHRAFVWHQTIWPISRANSLIAGLDDLGKY